MTTTTIARRNTNGARCEVLTCVVFIIIVLSLSLPLSEKGTIAACIICLLTTSKHTRTFMRYTRIYIIILLLFWFLTHINTQRTYIYLYAGSMIYNNMFYTRARTHKDGRTELFLSFSLVQPLYNNMIILYRRRALESPKEHLRNSQELLTSTAAAVRCIMYTRTHTRAHA